MCHVTWCLCGPAKVLLAFQMKRPISFKLWSSQIPVQLPILTFLRQPHKLSFLVLGASPKMTQMLATDAPQSPCYYDTGLHHHSLHN